jgi:hypothetical protein
MADIFQIWKDACPHPHPQSQDSEQLTWADLDDAAEAHYGMLDPRYVNFIDDGDDFGVDSDL